MAPMRGDDHPGSASTPEFLPLPYLHYTRRVRWVELTEVPDLMDPAYAVRVTDAFGVSTEPATRVHNGVHLLTGAWGE